MNKMQGSNRRVRMTLGVALACLVLAVAAISLNQQQGSPTVDDEHAARAASRAAAATQQEQALAAAVEAGLERNSAGFHLVRQGDDPDWRNGNQGPFSPRPEFSFISVRVAYTSMVYQNRFEGLAPTGRPGASAVLSIERLFANALCKASIQQEAGGTYKVVATFSPRSIQALRVLTANKFENADGSFVDWYWASRQSTDPPSKMIAAVVWNNLAYLPVDCQALLTSAGQGNGICVVATGMPQSDAEELVRLLSVP